MLHKCTLLISGSRRVWTEANRVGFLPFSLPFLLLRCVFYLFPVIPRPFSHFQTGRGRGCFTFDRSWSWKYGQRWFLTFCLFSRVAEAHAPFISHVSLRLRPNEAVDPGVSGDEALQSRILLRICFKTGALHRTHHYNLSELSLLSKGLTKEEPERANAAKEANMLTFRVSTKRSKVCSTHRGVERRRS